MGPHCGLRRSSWFWCPILSSLLPSSAAAAWTLPAPMSMPPGCDGLLLRGRRVERASTPALKDKASSMLAWYCCNLQANCPCCHLSSRSSDHLRVPHVSQRGPARLLPDAPSQQLAQSYACLPLLLTATPRQPDCSSLCKAVCQLVAGTVDSNRHDLNTLWAL